ncbi:WD40 repeat-like protein [Metschnikowia bicuspidata var. bicuspidata NRRL YB-4993]|uniref:WD40 repeat-like protein n=1 Tax=Metschnikowia bicuspidata var. bicuspidata NRRL YB-4993 TaxID=869754 RepID=A0A1A0H8R1_9ASCO|nr:WD40 repeat-like protein [Metschnikowia bicuspidata var. bicuspidata NRRL YB-4993]OBA20272.1 WD40 repeat-like protein [Metschnikowia bicuspidata var. bicuspidata NRRL YB-4993]
MADPIKCAYTAQALGPFYTGATPAAFARDSAVVATPLDDAVIVTDLASDRRLHTLAGDGESVSALAMTPDGTWLAVVSQSQQLRVYDMRSGALCKLHKFGAPVYMAAADGTSSLFAFGATDGLVCVWDIAGGYVTHALKGHGATVCALAFAGRLHLAAWQLASGDTMGTSKVWDLVARRCVASAAEHSGAVRGVAFLADGQHFLTAGRDEVAVLYRTSNLRRPVATLAVRHLVEACGFVAAAGRLLFYTAGTGAHLRLWDLAGRPAGGSRVPLATLEETVATHVAPTRGGAHLAMVLSDQTLVDLALENAQAQPGANAVAVPTARLIAGNHGIVADLRRAGPGLACVALATNAPALRIVDPRRPLDVQLCEGHTDLLNCLDVSPDGLWILTGSKDHDARLWRHLAAAGRFELHCTFAGHAGAVTACALPRAAAAAPAFVVTASADLTVKRWAVPAQAGATVRSSEYTRRAHDKDINAVAMAPNDALFATASFDKTAKVWDAASGDTVGVLRGHRRGLWDVSFCQYDRMVATAAGDKSVKVWLLHDYSCTRTLEGHTNAVQRVRFSSKNRQVVSCGADGLVKVWDLKDSDCVATLDNHANRIWAMDVSADGAHIVSADADGHMSFWADATDALAAQRQLDLKQRVEQEQALANCVGRRDWSSAFLLALTLDHLMRVYNVVKLLIAAPADRGLPVGCRLLEATMKALDPLQMAALLKRVRDWNINFKQFEIAQKVLAVVLARLDMADPDMRRAVDLIVPYNERHFLRLDAMLEETYVLDYVVQEMERA